VPVVFFHGIGVGLLTYIQFLAGIARSSSKPEAKIGVIAIELLPVSFRLTSPPPTKEEFLTQMARIVDHHGWDSYAIASHSYGSVLTTHMLHSPQLGPKVASVVLIDPVTISLHQPSVAYNFTRRLPRRANEWQLWYFASTDPSVALCLGRYFFWRDNIVWKEDLLGAGKKRRIAICLAGQDLIVDTPAVAEYLGKQEGLEVFVFPRLDHAQVFDDAVLRSQVVQLVKTLCSKETHPTG
jgi:pimeloyl-ACP methyl ester carboxylesterase